MAQIFIIFAGQSYCGVAADDSGRILGLYILHPNNVGRCGHIGNASYAVSSSSRGLHVGEKLVLDCLKQARRTGFHILQFNAVVAANTHARHLYERIGFHPLGTIPGGFRMKGEDLHADINVTFDEAVLGGTKRIHLRGSDGKEQSLDIKIPAGIESGKSIRLKGKGMPGSGGGEPGDLLLKVTVQEKPGFRREGMDIYTTVRIPYTTAVFGGEARIHTVYGDVVCKIKEGTQPGTKLRLRGKGAASVSNPSVRGDQYAVIEIQIPQNMGPEARQKLREYEQALKREQLHRTSAA